MSIDERWSDPNPWSLEEIAASYVDGTLPVSDANRLEERLRDDRDHEARDALLEAYLIKQHTKLALEALEEVQPLDQCRRVRPVMPAFADGGLPGAVTNLVSRHLDACFACRTHYEVLLRARYLPRRWVALAAVALLVAGGFIGTWATGWLERSDRAPAKSEAPVRTEWPPLPIDDPDLRDQLISQLLRSDIEEGTSGPPACVEAVKAADGEYLSRQAARPDVAADLELMGITDADEINQVVFLMAFAADMRVGSATRPIAYQSIGALVGERAAPYLLRVASETTYGSVFRKITSWLAETALPSHQDALQRLYRRAVEQQLAPFDRRDLHLDEPLTVHLSGAVARLLQARDGSGDETVVEDCFALLLDPDSRHESKTLRTAASLVAARARVDEEEQGRLKRLARNGPNLLGRTLAMTKMVLLDGPEPWLSRLRRLLTRENVDSKTRQIAVSVFAWSPDEKDVELLESLTRSEDKRVAGAARTALRRLGHRRAKRNDD